MIAGPHFLASRQVGYFERRGILICISRGYDKSGVTRDSDELGKKRPGPAHCLLTLTATVTGVAPVSMIFFLIAMAKQTDPAVHSVCF